MLNQGNVSFAYCGLSHSCLACLLSVAHHFFIVVVVSRPSTYGSLLLVMFGNLLNVTVCYWLLRVVR